MWVDRWCWCHCCWLLMSCHMMSKINLSSLIIVVDCCWLLMIDVWFTCDTSWSLMIVDCWLMILDTSEHVIHTWHVIFVFAKIQFLWPWSKDWLVQLRYFIEENPEKEGQIFQQLEGHPSLFFLTKRGPSQRMIISCFSRSGGCLCSHYQQSLGKLQLQLWNQLDICQDLVHICADCW